MKKTNSVKQFLSELLLFVLIAAMALSMSACGTGNETEAQPTPEATEASVPVAEELGEGDTAFTFTVVDADGNEKVFTINTDEKTVGDALLALGLIDGEDSEYGLYVKTVDGITADFDTDGTYWAFYINGEMASTGVDGADVEDGASYMLKVEK